MTTTNGFVPTEKMLDPTTLAEMLRISDRHLTDVRREDATFPAPNEPPAGVAGREESR